MVMTNIQWDVSVDDVFDTLKDLSDKQAAEIIGIKPDQYKKMTDDERKNIVLKKAKKKEFLYEFAWDVMHLPKTLTVPADMLERISEVTDWMAYEYGYRSKRFNMET